MPELADVFRQFDYDGKMSMKQRRVMSAISSCRTAALGAHVDRCAACSFELISYNSCGDRHCPKCQSGRRRKWVAARLSKLLPIQYFHVVFTLPDSLNDLVRRNERYCYDLLMKCAAETLQAFASRRWKGRLGITAVLHTWGQNLSYHPHVHCLVTGGALSEQRWRSAPAGYLFPVKALARVFRGKFIAGLKRGELVKPDLVKEKGLACWLRDQVARQWIVYAKAPFDNAELVVRYIGRYTHRVAISNGRIVSIEEGKVHFRWKDYRDGEQKLMKLSAKEFTRRFLQHVLPDGFVRIRHYGLHAVKELLERARALLGLVVIATTASLFACPRCEEGVLVFQYRMAAGKDPPVLY